MAVPMGPQRRLSADELLRVALDAESFTAAEAMDATGLTRATILGLCDELAAASWLEELEDSRRAGQSRRGRPARRLRLHRGAGVLVGVDAGRRGYRARAVDLRGRELAVAAREVDPADIAPDDAGRTRRRGIVREIVDEVLRVAAAEIAPTSTEPLVPLLTVIGIPAPVDPHGASPTGISPFWWLMNADFPEHLPGRVVVENDANLAALAEHARHPTDNLVTLLLSERIGAGIIIDGRLLHGRRGGAGEMRFLDAVLQDDVGAEGVAQLARRWALEALDAGDGRDAAAARDAADGHDATGTSADPAADGSTRPSPLAAIPRDRLSAPDIFGAAAVGDPLARAVLERIGERIARLSTILLSLLDVDRIVVAGGVSAAMGPVLEHARSRLPHLVRAPFPELVASELGSDVVLSGAVEHARALLRASPLDLLDPSPRRGGKHDPLTEGPP
ncbi:ROK family protein [Brachybacterium sp. J144]|uniref:ROK family protein n=1 Tax=Brachybacterium sp. J144 TaxID=3116487 RepID=UPI002E78E10A|nr:ROK family protein [Brachybacterium sp. J144]MEE1651838.1 ROK family protein [Brachybacterium sp. J144]